MDWRIYEIYAYINFVCCFLIGILWSLFGFDFAFGVLKVGAGVRKAWHALIQEGFSLLEASLIYLLPICILMIIVDISFAFISLRIRYGRKFSLFSSALLLLGSVLILLGWFGFTRHMNSCLLEVDKAFETINNFYALRQELAEIISDFYAKSINLIYIGFFLKGIGYILFAPIVCDTLQCSRSIPLVLVGVGIFPFVLLLVLPNIMIIVGYLSLSFVLYSLLKTIASAEKIKLQKNEL